MTPKVLALVPARGGSKGIPRKNVKPFCGKPLIAWSIEAGLTSGAVDRVVVSTDNEEIAEAARAAGAEVPFMRPAELAEDTTPTLPVLQHAVQWLKENEGYAPDYVLLLEPTSPGRQAFHIKEAIELVGKTGADSVIALGNVPGHFNYHWQVDLKEDGKALLVDGTPWPQVIRRRQDLPPMYFRNGAFYLFKTELLFADTPSLYGSDVRGYLVGPEYSIDIDSPKDWAEAEKIFEKLKETLDSKK